LFQHFGVNLGGGVVGVDEVFAVDAQELDLIG
jgi:hypothetical protein